MSFSIEGGESCCRQTSASCLQQVLIRFLIRRCAHERAQRPSIRSARLCPARKLPVRPNEMTGVAVGIVFQVILMLRLGLPEGTGAGYFGHHLARPKA